MIDMKLPNFPKSLKDYNASAKAHKIMRIPRSKEKIDIMKKMSVLQNPFLGKMELGDMWMEAMGLWKDVCHGNG